jgi:hypothetical protein
MNPNSNAGFPRPINDNGPPPAEVPAFAAGLNQNAASVAASESGSHNDGMGLEELRTRARRNEDHFWVFLRDKKLHRYPYGRH